MSTKSENSVFSKLYRYYCRKLLELWPRFLLLFFIFGLQIYVIFNNPSSGEQGEIIKNSSWQDNFWKFFLISFGQLQICLVVLTFGISRLVGLSFSFGFKFRIPKRSNVEDIHVVTLVPNAKREIMVNAKITAIFTYFFGINLLSTLLLFFYFLSSLPSTLPAFVFLITNGLVFCLVNFLLVVPYLFYFYETYSLLSVLVYLVVFIAGFAGYLFFRETIKNYSMIIPLVSVPLSLLVGYLFSSLYRQKFLQRDLV